MGQKVNPVMIRLKVNREHDAKWFTIKKFADNLESDNKIRHFLEKKLVSAGVNRILIERPARNARITIYTARPGAIIGRKGNEVDDLRQELVKMVGVPVQLNIEEVRKPDMEAKLVAEYTAQQIEKRVSFRRLIKRAVQNAMRQGALGIKIAVSGRLGGAEIARTEWYREGRVPLHTFRANVDYALAVAQTTYGSIGVKVWIFRGEVIQREEHSSAKG